MIERLRLIVRMMGDTGRAMVGIGSYEAYIDHLAREHPEQAAMTRAEWFENRQKAHYGEGASGVTRCC